MRAWDRGLNGRAEELGDNLGCSNRWNSNRLKWEEILGDCLTPGGVQGGNYLNAFTYKLFNIYHLANKTFQSRVDSRQNSGAAIWSLDS